MARARNLLRALGTGRGIPSRAGPHRPRTRAGPGPAPSAAAGPERGAQSGSGVRRWLTPWCASLEEVS